MSKLAINMEGGFQTDKGVEYDEELKIVVLPNMETFDINNPDLPMNVNLSVAAIRLFHVALSYLYFSILGLQHQPISKQQLMLPKVLGMVKPW